ncbi:hypothetical protein R69608_03456 [Paraburkholderia nemoris]|jgi:hypothetical protein|uniref:hypothetical protein n=1 Tax=Paraburkholderia nemoris TaxID=2793076 RepID=UPI001912ABA1|nr:hypothetical protein [Paraburkholderia nemoris]MBK5148782.1 hypothetical protein [Burkholderia sp. R-69608]CAE6909700.1 hypothetical protein R69608_03456 [Paraburkholderia nemoris]
MESNLRINLVALKNAPIIAKIAILIYCVASLQFLCLTLGGIFFMIEPIFKPAIPLDAIIWIAAILFAYGGLKLFLAFKLLKRKNWARIGAVIVSALLAAFLIQGAINIAMVTQHAFFDIVKHNYGLVAEIVAASLLLLPQSRGWFASKRTSA